MLDKFEYPKLNRDETSLWQPLCYNRKYWPSLRDTSDRRKLAHKISLLFLDMDSLTLTYITLLSVAVLLWLYTLVLLFSGSVRPIWTIIKGKFKASTYPSWSISLTKWNNNSKSLIVSNCRFRTVSSAQCSSLSFPPYSTSWRASSRRGTKPTTL